MPSLGTAIGLPFGGIPSSGPSFALDAYEGNLFECWSCARRLLASHTGALVRLRRSSDSAESDFGFDADGELDAAAITTWKGASTLFLVTLYGQKGVANMTQAVAAIQFPFNTSGAGGSSKPYYGPGADLKFAETAAFTAYTGTDHTWGAAGDPDATFRRFASAKNTGATRQDFLGNRDSLTSSAVRINGDYVSNTIASSDWRVNTCRKSGNGANNIRLLSNESGPTLGTLGSDMDIVCYHTGFSNGAEIFVAHAALSTASQDAIHAEMRAYYGL